MKLGCCTTIGNYRQVYEMGYDYIELPGFEVTAQSETQWQAFLQEKNELGLPVLGFNAYSAGQPAIIAPPATIRPLPITRVGLFSGARRRGSSIWESGLRPPGSCPQRFPAMRPPVS